METNGKSYEEEFYTVNDTIESPISVQSDDDRSGSMKVESNISGVFPIENSMTSTIENGHSPIANERDFLNGHLSINENQLHASVVDGDCSNLENYTFGSSVENGHITPTRCQSGTFEENAFTESANDTVTETVSINGTHNSISMMRSQASSSNISVYGDVNSLLVEEEGEGVDDNSDEDLVQYMNTTATNGSEDDDQTKQEQDRCGDDELYNIDVKKLVRGPLYFFHIL